jgi:hypothetical protein
MKTSVTTLGKIALDAKLTSVVTSAESAGVPFLGLRQLVEELNIRKSMR